MKISEQYQANLPSSELADIAPVGLLRADAAGHGSYLNAEFNRLSACGVGLFSASDWFAAVHPDDRDQVRMHWQRMVSSHERVSFDARFQRPDGSVIAFRGQARPVLDSAGSAEQYLLAACELDPPAVATAVQPTAVQPTAVQLSTGQPAPAAHLERLLVLLRVIPCAVILEDANNQIILVNHRFCRMFDPSTEPADWMGRPGAEVANLVSALVEDPAGYHARLDRLIAGRDLTTDEVPTLDGRLFERDYVPIIEATGYDGHVWMFWDFTERKAAEVERERQLRAEITAQRLGVHAQRERAVEAEQTGRALAEQNEALAAIDALRSQLLATASHELRTPLTSILSCCELLSDGIEASSEEAEFIGVIQRNAARLRHLVDDLLLLARLGSGAQSIELQRVDLAQLAHRVVLDCSLAATERQVTVEVGGQESLWLSVDPARLVQVLDNLIGNAIKYSRPGGAVQVTLGLDVQQATIEVSDSGIGIPLSEQGELFGQFFRASSALASGIPGTGLGLAIVRTIVELHQGTVSLTSELGVGTTVLVRLPIGPATE